MSPKLVRAVAMWLAIASFLPFTPPFQTWDASRISLDFDITNASNPHDGSLNLTLILSDAQPIANERNFGQPLLHLPAWISRLLAPPIVLRL
jgi:hypothetical protein